MFNKVIIVGNLTREVELKYLPSGSAVSTIGLASGRKYKKQDGSQGEEVCFIDVKLFGRTAEVANQYLKKGSQVLIEGRLNLETWSDQNGSKRSKHTITAESMQMLGRSNTSSNTLNYDDSSMPISRDKDSNNISSNKMPEIDIDEDEIPF